MHKKWLLCFKFAATMEVTKIAWNAATNPTSIVIFETIPPKKSFLENTCFAHISNKFKNVLQNSRFCIAKLNSIKLRTTHRMNSTTFSNLVKLGGGMKKKAKKKKGKPGKVWNCYVHIWVSYLPSDVSSKNSSGKLTMQWHHPRSEPPGVPLSCLKVPTLCLSGRTTTFFRCVASLHPTSLLWLQRTQHIVVKPPSAFASNLCFLKCREKIWCIGVKNYTTSCQTGCHACYNYFNRKKLFQRTWRILIILLWIHKTVHFNWFLNGRWRRIKL